MYYFTEIPPKCWKYDQTSKNHKMIIKQDMGMIDTDLESLDIKVSDSETLVNTCWPFYSTKLIGRYANFGQNYDFPRFSCGQMINISQQLGIFFKGGWGNFFKATLMTIIKVQNVFLIINIDVLDRLGHVWDIFDIVGSWNSISHRQIFHQNQQILAFLRLL